jgi:hypothetical protein
MHSAISRVAVVAIATASSLWLVTFTGDRKLLDIMSRATVLIIPTLNGDGRAANTRGSSTGQDLNRDHSLLREPETKAFAAMLRDYTPDVAVDGHNGDSEDLPLLGPRHLNRLPT